MKFTWEKATAFAAAGLFVALPALAQENSTAAHDQSQKSSHSKMAKGNSGDMRFAKEAAIGGMTEVELGKLATQKASSDQVKQFGQKMVDDHGKAGDELKEVASKNSMTLPTDLDAKHKAMVDKMSKYSGAQFDRMYVNAMVKDHDQDVAEFTKESNSGTNADLKSWAGKTLPTLQEHDKMIKDIQSNMGSSKK